MSNENFIEIDQAITDALNQFSPVRLKKAGLEAARYLRKENAFRVRKAQRLHREKIVENEVE